MSNHKNFEVRYCMEIRENVAIEVQRAQNGSYERHCLHRPECQSCAGLPYFPDNNCLKKNA